MIEKLASLRWPILVATIALLAATICGCKTQPRTKPPMASTNALATFDSVWRLISETHYDTNYGGVDWNAIRDEFRPKAANAKSDRETRIILQTMLNRLGMSHTAVIPASRSNGTDPKSGTPSATKTPILEEDRTGESGFEFRIIDRQYVVTHVEPDSSASVAGVKLGWVIKSIDGCPVSEDSESTASVGKHEALLQWSQIGRRLNGPPGGKIHVEFLDDRDQSITLDIPLHKNKGMPVKLGHLPVLYARMRHERLTSKNPVSIGYLQFNVWMLPLAAAIDEAIDALRDCDGIVLDLRGNIGGVAAMTIGFSGHFLDKPLVLGVMKTRETELTLTANPRTVNSKGEPVTPFEKPLAILVDEISASTSEMFAGSMQSLGRARIFGTTTLGEVLPAVYDKLPNGDFFLHAFGDFRTSKGERLEGHGVIPDTTVSLTRKDLLAGRDSVLESAADWIAHQH